jgi:hypothetical protein
LCKCGCGKYTKIANQKVNKGKPNMYLRGHNGVVSHPTGRKGIRLSATQRFVATNGYAYIRESATSVKFVYEHILVAERALGKPLPKGAQVHHVNERRNDNRNKNLVICQDTAYHRLLHLRMRALRGCGKPNFRRCGLCRKFDDPAQLLRGEVHRYCWAKYKRDKRKRNKNGR